MRTLYVAHSGPAFAAWWDREPPPPPVIPGKPWPACPPPDVHLLGAYGVDPLALLGVWRVLPRRDEYRLRHVSSVWAERGVRLAVEAKRAARTKPPSPEQSGLFAAEHVGRIDHHPLPVRKVS